MEGGPGLVDGELGCGGEEGESEGGGGWESRRWGAKGAQEWGEVRGGTEGVAVAIIAAASWWGGGGCGAYGGGVEGRSEGIEGGGSDGGYRGVDGEVSSFRMDGGCKRSVELCPLVIGKRRKICFPLR